MAGEFAMGAVAVGALLDRQLDLSAGFKGDRGSRAFERQDPSFLVLRFVTEPVGEALEDRFNTARARKGDGAGTARVHRDLFVFRADSPLLARLVTTLKIVEQFLLAADFITHRIPTRMPAPRCGLSWPWPTLNASTDPWPRFVVQTGHRLTYAQPRPASVVLTRRRRWLNWLSR